MKKLFSCIVTVSAFISDAPPAFGSASDWPQWRGHDRSAVSTETGLLQSWPEGGPKRVWLYQDAGEGYSGPAIAGGKLFTMGTRGDAECILALEARTGAELWVAEAGLLFTESRGNGPRSTPAVDGAHVYALTSRGDLVCAGVDNGEILWRQSLTRLGGRVPTWGYSESVLVDGDQVVCTPGGQQGAIVAFHKTTGRLLWQSKEFTDPAHYSSLVPAEINGVRQYIQLTAQNIAGVAAADGKLLWTSPFPGRTAVIPTPIHRDNHVYVTAGYNAGCKLVRIRTDHQAVDVYQNSVMQNHHGGVVLVGDHLYGYSDSRGWICQDFQTGEQIWSERRALGRGAIGYADGRLYCLDQDTGTVVLAGASPEGWKEHGRFRLAPQSDIRPRQGRIWTHPVISHGKLYLRDQDLIYCFNVSQ